MTPKEAAAWMRMDSQERRDWMRYVVVAPTVAMLDQAIINRNNVALQTLIAHAENT